MVEWVQAFFTWWLASPQGIGASQLASNFAISWDSNAMAMAHYLGHAYAGAFSQTYGSILAVLHINDVSCCWSRLRVAVQGLRGEGSQQHETIHRDIHSR